MSPDPNISAFRARQVCAADFSRFDHIIALDQSNLNDLHDIMPPKATAQLSLLFDHVPGRKGQSVADPYCGDAKDFARCWQDVAIGAAGLVKWLKSVT